MKNLTIGQRVAWAILIVMSSAGTILMIDEATADKALFQEHLVMAIGFAVLIVGSLWFVQRLLRKHFPPNE